MRRLRIFKWYSYIGFGIFCNQGIAKDLFGDFYNYVLPIKVIKSETDLLYAFLYILITKRKFERTYLSMDKYRRLCLMQSIVFYNYYCGEIYACFMVIYSCLYRSHCIEIQLRNLKTNIERY
jgi:hypothetical protein